VRVEAICEIQPSTVLDHVADAAHRRDHFVPVLGVDLLAEMVDHDVDDDRAGVEVISPSILRDQRAAHDAAAVAHEVFEHRVLLRRQLDQLTAAPHLPCALIELEIAHVELVGRDCLWAS
jgi:hypothetical protein